MYHNTRPQIQQGGHLLRSGLLQFLVYFGFALALPMLVWSSLRGVPLFQGGAYTTWTIAAAAMALVWYTLNQLRQYARARLLSYVLPVNLLFFGGVLAILAIGRLPYTSTLFASIAGSTLAVSYMITAVTRISNRIHYFIPGGRVSSMANGDWFVEVDQLDELQSLVESQNRGFSIVADLHHSHPPKTEKLLAKAALRGIPVYHFRQIWEQHTGQVRITHLSENDLGSLIPNLPYMNGKRLLDVVATLLLLPLLIPLLLILAIIVKIDSPGSILFVQERIGFRGELFRMVKFRTMRVRAAHKNADAKREDAMTRDDDGRITRSGHFMRKTRLDELPQIWNILRGEMSWIGPRPEAQSLSEWYEEEIPFYSYRHIVRPGISGWAQVNQGHVTDLDAVNNKLRYDFYYVKNISAWLDALIALKTIRVVLLGFGAR